MTFAPSGVDVRQQSEATPEWRAFARYEIRSPPALARASPPIDHSGMTTSPELKRIAEGREAEIFEWEPGTVLRLFRDARSAASIAHECAAMEAVRAVVPMVPKVFGVTEVMGRPGIIMERIDGPDLLTLISQKPWTVWSSGRLAGQVQAQLHSVVAPPSIPALRERAERYRGGTDRVPAHIAEWALLQFDAMADGDRLLHGDFHPANILMAASGPVVIDWPNVTRGNPDADLARSLLMIRIGSLPPGTPIVIRLGAKVARALLEKSYLRAYRRTRDVEMAVVERWVILRAADRLLESIADEREQLLQMLEKTIAAGG